MVGNFTATGIVLAFTKFPFNCKALIPSKPKRLQGSVFASNLFYFLGVAPLLLAAPGFALQLRLRPKAAQAGVFVAIPNAQGPGIYYHYYFCIGFAMR
jgi:hypothetical protein